MFVFGILLSHSPFGFRFMITCDIFAFHYHSVGISKLQSSECVFGSVQFHFIRFGLVLFKSFGTSCVCVCCVANFDMLSHVVTYVSLEVPIRSNNNQTVTKHKKKETTRPTASGTKKKSNKHTIHTITHKVKVKTKGCMPHVINVEKTISRCARSTAHHTSNCFIFLRDCRTAITSAHTLPLPLAMWQPRKISQILW